MATAFLNRLIPDFSQNADLPQHHAPERATNQRNEVSMPIQRQVIRATMKALIDRLGCLDAAAETINARWSKGGSKGTLSKKSAGFLSFTIEDVIALEDAQDLYPITKLMARRLSEREACHGEGVDCLMVQSGLIAKESGEAVSAILCAENSADAEDQAQAIKEIDEAIAALNAARARMTQKPDFHHQPRGLTHDGTTTRHEFQHHA